MADVMTEKRPILHTQSSWGIALCELRRNPGAIAGAVVLLLLILMAVFAPVLAPYDPIKVVPQASFQPPSAEHWLGADRYGRDVLSRIVYGARISLTVGLISVGLAAAVGVPAGLLAGWDTGTTSALIMRFTDAMLALPGILLALSIIAVLGPGLSNAMIAVGISNIPTYIRLVRGGVLSARENVYVDAARVIGCSTTRIMYQHILPNVVAPVIVLSTLGIATSILSAASLSFLGLGAQPPTPDWGTTVSEGRDVLDFAWWISTFPSLVIMITVLAINLLGDGLRDALDPRLRQR
ncbi:MAG: ABC transporter permease [Chloroflexi bacterium]|nr:ABC transporter permease [Chloroflexota bacterium]